MQQNDQTILADALSACAQGKRDALRLIFEREGGRMIAVAQRILRRRELAEDVVQEAFIVIWTKADQYAPERGSARGWIYAIARNRALNMLRDGRRLELTDADSLADLQDAASLDHSLDVWSDLEQHDRLRECLSRLDEAKRQSILMAYMSGYTHGEIAGRLRVPLGTAKAWVRRGLASLRECMV
ncbi:sigma-70 family RNA polymerase sigma factor [Pararhizobium antarcticum]|uniref:RNA polymerase subunit sigma n=1 Tax=Pararhizobium antarcticum TaxID=1798805 RepID=A0A657LQ95_9HYPH|nr:sigma-70 family RNA polymerase sigma factor [Pararhizobium antarcticum]OJF95039.1 RNA polymerase subunit sigma [Pararhizobium antarcticum]OJF98140.1 RNA polymerase subunit sigma [Rhizobium sp. 58]